MPERSKAFLLGSIVGAAGGLIVGGTLVALFWNDVAAAIRRLVRRIFKRDDQVNFEILLQ